MLVSNRDLSMRVFAEGFGSDETHVDTFSNEAIPRPLLD